VRIVPIDVGYLGLAEAANAFLVRGPVGDALVECGTATTWSTLAAGLAAHGVAPAGVGDLLLTHIHLDHAGAAGHLAEAGARVRVHPFGMAHLVDPARLVASSRRVHGTAYDRFYGDLRAVASERILAVEDGARIEVAGLVFEAMHTPGHARHHVVWLLDHAGERHAFMGDLAGILVPGSEFVAVPTPPPEFDPDAWRASLARVIDARPSHLWLTHGGLVGGSVRVAEAFLRRASDRLSTEVSWLRELVATGVDEPTCIRAYGRRERAAARAAGVDDARMADFVDDAFLRMNLGGARRAFTPRP
jgi:glyoxylase-like metal-dependent hydrolase (beta-lactamase superfamily II)